MLEFKKYAFFKSNSYPEYFILSALEIEKVISSEV